MSEPLPLLPLGSLVAGAYEIREHLGTTADGNLYLALAGDGGRTSRHVMLALPADGPPDLRPTEPGARQTSTPIPAVRASFGLPGQRLLALGCQGGQLLSRLEPLASDESVLAVLCELAAGLMQLVSQDASVAGYRADQILVMPDGAVCYVGPVVTAGEHEQPVATLARLAEQITAPGVRWTQELRALLEQLAEPLGFAGIRGALGAMVELVGTSDLVGTAAVASDPGPLRASNEDAGLTIHECQSAADGLLELDLVAVADGLGGHRDGARAAQLALQTLTSGFGMAQAVALASGGPLRWHHNEAVWEAIDGAVAAADETVAALAEPDELYPPASTLVAAVRVGRRLFVRHVGDSRAYLWRAGKLERLTRDDSFVQELVDGGRLTAEEAKLHPDNNLITRYIGSGQAGAGSSAMRLLQAGDRLLLCSDGITGALSDRRLGALIAAGASATELAETLVGAACAAGTTDNATAAVLVFEDGAQPDADGAD